MSTQEDIQKVAAILAMAREELAEALRAMQREIDQVKEADMPRVKKAARTVAKDHTRLAQLIQDNRGLFAKPRTQVVAGLKYGIQKRRGKMHWASDAQLVDRIKKLAAQGEISAGEREMLVAVTERPVAKALEQLDVRVLKRLGVTVDADCDEVLIKSVDSEIERAINAIIKDVTQDENAEVAA